MKKGSNKSSGSKTQGAARRHAAKASNGPGPFKPSVQIPRSLPVASSSPPRTTTVAKPTVLASDPGLLERVGHEADEALAIGKRVLTLLNVESKGSSYSILNVAVDYNGIAYQPLASISQGSSDSTRDGDSLKFKAWKGHLQFTRGGVDAICAIMLIQEGPTFVPTYGTYPAVCFASIGTAGAPLSEPVWDARLGFKILRHEVFSLTNSDPYRIVKWDHKFNHDVQYYNGTGVVYEGNVTVVFISNITGATAPTISFGTTYSWVDN